MIRLVGLLCLLLLNPTSTFAQSEEFTIRVFGSVDTQPPTTPVITSINALTTDQIDLSWSTSTDNFVVFGYVVLRDGVAIATTTETTYSDSGLSASTTYSYQVTAFDNVPNYSTTSVAVATTTLAIPVIPEEPLLFGTIARVVLDSVDVTTSVASANINVQVRMPARIEVRIGETPGYEKGYFVGSIYRRGHNVPINDLRANTTYYYEVIGYTPYGVQTILHQGSFVTQDDTPPPSPPNVENFTVGLDGTGVRASWVLPTDFADNARVRIVRSHLGFPTTLDDGVVVYEGSGDTVQDEEAFAAGEIAYYTAFVIDPEGLVSSGAVALIAQAGTVDLPGDIGNLLPRTNRDTDLIKENSSSTYSQVVPDPQMPHPRDIQVIQSGLVASFASSTIDLASDELFFVSIPADKIAGAFKTIVVTLTDPRGSGKTFSFLLRLNNEQTAYSATIAPVQVAGSARLLLDVYDYEAKVVGSYQTELVFTKSRGTSSSTFEVLWWQLQSLAWGLLLIAPLLTLGGVWWLFWRRKGEG